MKLCLTPLIIGIILGVIDILPMIKQKLDNYAISSAFVFHLIMPIIVANINLPIVWWLQGGLLYIICCIPTVILAAKEDKKAAPIILITTSILGTLAGVMIHFFC